jgi:hypothetical protein
MADNTGHGLLTNKEYRSSSVGRINASVVVGTVDRQWDNSTIKSELFLLQLQMKTTKDTHFVTGSGVRIAGYDDDDDDDDGGGGGGGGGGDDDDDDDDNNNNNNNTTPKTKISHLLYVDDLKLLGKSKEELQKQIHTVTTFCHDIRMEFGLDKYANLYLTL